MLVAMHGLINFRDVGGLPVPGGRRTRFGVLLRSDCLSNATDADAEYLRKVVGLRTIVDLREVDEVAEAGRGPLGGSSIGYVSLPLGDTDTITPATRSDYYARLIERHGTVIADLIRQLSSPDTVPALLHCRLGQDRTGSVVALLLRLAGVADSDICDEYALSGRANLSIRARAKQRRRDLGLPDMDESYYLAWDPTAAVMAATLTVVDERWGGVDGWARAHGLTEVEIDAWRDTITEPGGA